MKHYQVWTKNHGTDKCAGDVKSDGNWYINILSVVSQDLLV